MVLQGAADDLWDQSTGETFVALRTLPSALRSNKAVIQHTRAFNKLNIYSNVEIRTVTNIFVYFAVYNNASCFDFLKSHNHAM